MSAFSFPIQIRWSDIDANRHMRHSVYYDYGATARMIALSDGGLTTSKLEELQVGPVLFREEAVFRREVLLEDKISIDTVLTKATPDFGRWSLRHQIVKEGGTIAAIINVDGAWIDMVKRKLAAPNEFIQTILAAFPRSEDFQFTETQKKSA
jgi:acyl-CoA thioester hydrolase